MQNKDVDVSRLIAEWKRQTECKDENFVPETVTGENSIGKYTEVAGHDIVVRTYHRDKYSICRNVA